MARQRTRRLQKKLRRGPFRELGFEVSIRLQPGIPERGVDHFWDEFIRDAIEGNELIYGGGANGFVVALGRRSATEAERERIRGWLASRPEVATFELGPLVDAWHSA
jgi:uncharacterized protein